MNSLLTKTIRTCALFAIVAKSATAEIPNLGVISQRTGATIQLGSTRPGFILYRVEVKPDGPPTNIVTLTLTNDLLSLEQMGPIPSGPGVLGVKAVYSDGEESECAVYRYDLRRSKPSAPSMTPTHIGGPTEGSSSLTNQIRKIRERQVIPAPPRIPEYTSGLDAPVPKRQQIVDRPTALPNGTNLSYFQFLDRLADSAGWGRRRSQ